MPRKGPYKLPFVPSKEWTSNYIHLMRWGWYPGTTEVRRYMPSESFPIHRAFWLNKNLDNIAMVYSTLIKE
jgi:hypothetical protein